MADDLGDWDDEDYAPPDVKVVTALGEEVVKKLDEDEKKAEAAAAAPSQQKEKTKKDKKGKDKDKAQKEDSAEVAADGKVLTQKELEDIQRASDLAVAAETFGIQLEATFDRAAEPTTKEGYDNLLKFLSEKLGSFSKNENYYDFLSGLFTELCVKLDSEHIRRYGKELTALGAEKLKEEKEKEKAKQPKSKKKPTLVTKKAGDLDDVVGETQGYVDYGDDEDFM